MTGHFLTHPTCYRSIDAADSPWALQQLGMLVITLVALLRLAVTSGRLVVGSEAELYLETGQLDTERVLALATLHNSSRHPYRWGCRVKLDVT